MSTCISAIPLVSLGDCFKSSYIDRDDAEWFNLAPAMGPQIDDALSDQEDEALELDDMIQWLRDEYDELMRGGVHLNHPIPSKQIHFDRHGNTDARRLREELRLLTTHRIYRRLCLLSGITPCIHDCCLNSCCAYLGEYDELMRGGARLNHPIPSTQIHFDRHGDTDAR